MRLPIPARSILSLAALLAGGAMLGACSGDLLAPVSETSTGDAVSPFAPGEASKALVGVSDGPYRFNVDPSQEQRLFFGANMLHLPANSICDVETSGYGASSWKSACTPETSKQVITAVVSGAATLNPRIDFHPAMRFNPETKVSLYMYTPDPLQRKAAQNWVIKYCDDSNVCVNEALVDPSLVTRIDKRSKIVYRRIKHFSGFIITSLMDDAGSGAPSLLY